MQEFHNTGITPADAGKTESCLIKYALTKDHPRGCGENRSDQASRFRREGSPPRMRGKPTLNDGWNEYGRITPADAGKTKLRAAYHVVSQDHPRGCGENKAPIWNTFVNLGSPPRMRGKRGNLIIPVRRDRITPADAGKTDLLRFRTFRREDHPRGCGENAMEA